MTLHALTSPHYDCGGDGCRGCNRGEVWDGESECDACGTITRESTCPTCDPCDANPPPSASRGGYR